MPPLSRMLFRAAMVLAVAGCSRDGASPTSTDARADGDLLTAASADPALGAAPAQASLPGLTMDPEATYRGSVGAADACTYSPAEGRAFCAPVTRNGLTITRSIGWYDAAGKPQARRDSATRSMNTQIGVKGTVTREGGTTTVDRSSSLTVSGLGRGATTHTLNGSETGALSSTFTTSRGTASSQERFTVATKDVVVPVEVRNRWPLSGTTSRTSTMTATRGPVTRTSTTSHTVVFDGTSTPTVTVVRDGVTRSCTADLAAHRLSCP